jgi:hypothetical protein
MPKARAEAHPIAERHRRDPARVTIEREKVAVGMTVFASHARRA